MSGLVEIATAILSVSERRLETISANVANIATPGYKRQISFADVVASRANQVGGVLKMHTRPDLGAGKLSQTGNPLDLAISGYGYFKLRDGAEIVYSRGGQFQLASDGTVTTASGQVLQQAGGGDLVLDKASVEILADGTVLDGDRPVGRVALFSPANANDMSSVGGSMFRFSSEAEEVGEPQMRQGMIETSNVAVGDEMIATMAALRQAESGAKLVQTYDDLLGRAITTFGQSGR